MSGDEYITGVAKLGVGATFQNSSADWVTVMNNVDLNAQIHDATNRAALDAVLPCTKSYSKLDGSVATITGVVGNNVICVGDINLSGKQITLTGPVGTRFILNITGKFSLTGGGSGPQIRAGGGVQPKDILYNVIGTGPDVAFSGGGGGVGCCQAIVDGTILAPKRKIALAPGLVNGEIISGMDISIVSGSSIRCPACNQGSVVPTGLRLTSSSCKVTLAWNVLPGATGYKLWRSTTSGGGYILLQSGLTSLTATDNTAVDGVAYYYVVSAILNAADTGYSGEVAVVTTGGLPSGWSTADIGSVAVVGGAGYVNSTFTVSGSGAGIGGTVDACRFLYMNGSKDCIVVAKVVSLSGPASTKVAVMIRETTAATAKEACVYLTPSAAAAQHVQPRSTSGGATSSLGSSTALAAPYYLKITRSVANVFSFYASSDGSFPPASLIGTTTLSMADSVVIGLGVTSGVDGTYSTAKFDHVTVTP